MGRKRAACLAGMMAWLAAPASALAQAAPSASAPSSTPQVCQAMERRALDFWVGDWDLTWQGGAASSHVEKTLGGCALEETFQASGDSRLRGRSLTSYDPDTNRWRQAWSDDQGGSLMLSGGPYGRDFILYKLRFSNEDPFFRAMFEDVTPNAFTWRWQRSNDGKSWQDALVINYVRRTAAGAP